MVVFGWDYRCLSMGGRLGTARKNNSSWFEILRVDSVGRAEGWWRAKKLIIRKWMETLIMISKHNSFFKLVSAYQSLDRVNLVYLIMTHIKKCVFSCRTTKVWVPTPQTLVVFLLFLSLGNGLRCIKLLKNFIQI